MARTKARARRGARAGRRLKRKSFFLDEAVLREVKKDLGVATEAEAVRLALLWIADNEKFRRFMDETRGASKPGAFVVD